MKSFSYKVRKGFTLVELMVVMTIIAVMMSLMATVLRDPGGARTLDSGVDLLTNLIAEARATAQGNDTYTRLVIANDPNDTSRTSRHLRYVVVQMFKKTGTNNDGTSMEMQGEWVSTSSGNMLPPGVYFSPTYSQSLSWADGAGNRIATDMVRVSRDKRVRAYCFEFDEKGRYVSPAAGPTTPSQPHRLVLINARPGKGRDSHDGIIALQLDSRRRPLSAKGLVIWPNGNTSPLRTQEQVYAR